MSCCERRISRLLAVVFLLGTATSYSLFLFFFFFVLVAALELRKSGLAAAREAGRARMPGSDLGSVTSDSLVFRSFSRRASSGARRGSTRSLAPMESARGADATRPIPGHASEHKGKFGSSRRMASRTSSSRTTVSPSNVSTSASSEENSYSVSLDRRRLSRSSAAWRSLAEAELFLALAPLLPSGAAAAPRAAPFPRAAPAPPAPRPLAAFWASCASFVCRAADVDELRAA